MLPSLPSDQPVLQGRSAAFLSKPHKLHHILSDREDLILRYLLVSDRTQFFTHSFTHSFPFLRRHSSIQVQRKTTITVSTFPLRKLPGVTTWKTKKTATESRIELLYIMCPSPFPLVFFSGTALSGCNDRLAKIPPSSFCCPDPASGRGDSS